MEFVKLVKLLLCDPTVLVPVCLYHKHVHIAFQILLTHLMMTYLLKHPPCLVPVYVSVSTCIIFLKDLIKLLP